MIEPPKNTRNRITIHGAMPALGRAEAERGEPRADPVERCRAGVPALGVEVGAADGAARGERAHGLAAVGATAPVRHRAQDGADPAIRNRTIVRIPGVENVWDYPRPPAVEPCTRRVRVELSGVVLADSSTRCACSRRAIRRRSTCRRRTCAGPADPSRARSTVVRVQGRGALPRRRVGDRGAGGVDLPGALAGLRGAARPRRASTRARGRRVAGRRAACSPRRATSTAAGSPPTSPGRSRGRRARWAGRSLGVLITSEFLTDYEPPDLGPDASFFVVARTEGFGEDDENGGEARSASAGSRTARGSPTARCSRWPGRCC